MFQHLKKHRNTFYLGVSMAIIVVTLHALASEFSWYWVFRGFDIPMHILGGLVSGYFGVWVYIVLRQSANIDQRQIFRIAIGSGLLIGVLWEFLEAGYGLSGLDAIYRADVIKDIINDMIGGCGAYVIWRIFLKKDNAK